MGQQEIISFLKKERQFTDKYFSAKEIQRALNLSHQAVYKSLTKMIVFNQIEWKGQGVWKHRKMFRYKPLSKRKC